MGIVKTRLDFRDEFLARAKRNAWKTGHLLRAVVEEGKRNVLPQSRRGRVGERRASFSVRE